MRILGIDYGRKKVGVAIATGFLAEPYKILRYEDIKILVKEINEIVGTERIEKVIVGISEGEMGKESRGFSLSLRERLDIPVATFDETLSTQEALRLSIEAGHTKGKRKRLEDAYAASVMLQSYLDSYV